MTLENKLPQKIFGNNVLPWINDGQRMLLEDK